MRPTLRIFLCLTQMLTRSGRYSGKANLFKFSWCPALWMPYGLYKEDEVVQTADGRYVKAKPNPAVKGVAADPMNSAQDMFYWLCSTPCKLMNIMCVFEFCLIAAQFWMLVLTTDWQHIVTLVLLMFANYLLLAKLFKDRVSLNLINS